jgi:hypothetical protein
MSSYSPGYGDVSYDSNGYLSFLPTPDYGTNPWTSLVQTQQGNVNNAQNAAGSMLPMMQNQLQGQVQAFQQFANTSGYPSWPNPAGLGTQIGLAPTQQATSQNQTASQPADISSRGLNPWSLKGEAMARY